MTIQVNLCCLLHKDSEPNSSELSLLKLTYHHHSYFLTTTFDFISFSTMHGFFPHSFLQLKLDFISFRNCILLLPALDLLLLIFFFTTGSSVERSCMISLILYKKILAELNSLRIPIFRKFS